MLDRIRSNRRCLKKFPLPRSGLSPFCFCLERSVGLDWRNRMKKRMKKRNQRARSPLAVLRFRERLGKIGHAIHNPVWVTQTHGWVDRVHSIRSDIGAYTLEAVTEMRHMPGHVRQSLAPFSRSIAPDINQIYHRSYPGTLFSLPFPQRFPSSPNVNNSSSLALSYVVDSTSSILRF